jgi:hypothetical protein
MVIRRHVKIHTAAVSADAAERNMGIKADGPRRLALALRTMKEKRPVYAKT